MNDQLSVTRVVMAAPSACHDLVANVEGYTSWARDLKDVSVDQRDAEGRASVVTFRVAAMGRSATYTLSYDYSQAPQVISWSLVEGDIVRMLDGSYRFASVVDEPGQCEIEYELEVELAVPLPGFVKRRAEGRIMHAALDDLQARLEA